MNSGIGYLPSGAIREGGFVSKIIGEVLVISGEGETIEEFPIKEIAQPSDRKISIDLVEPNGTLATVTFESQDGKNFVGTYRKKDQRADGILRVKKGWTKDGTLVLGGKWGRDTGEECIWAATIEPSDD